MTLSPISIDNVRQLLKLAELPISDVDEVAFSLDNQYLACGRYNGVVLLDYISGRIVHSFSTKEPVSHLSYSSRGEYLAGIANGLYVWSANSLELISKHPGSGYHNHYMDLRFVSDQQGERLLIAHLDKIEVLDTSSWRIVGESQCRDDIILLIVL
jgi:WD40 repeat protein